MSELETLIARSNRIIDRAVRTHKLTALIALFSGGPDSIVATHIASQHPLFRGCIHINTKTSPLSEIASRNAIARMETFGWEYVVGTPFLTFRQLVAKYGFPGPASHSMIYQYLKGRPIRQAKSEWIARLEGEYIGPEWMRPTTKQKPRIGFITGIRAEESQRRSHAPEVQFDDGTAWISPILHWRGQDRAPYFTEYVGEMTYGSSRQGTGECDCAAYASPGEMDLKCANNLMLRYRETLEHMARVSRELDMIEAEAGMRDEADVMPEAFTLWGHGKNARGASIQAMPAVSICNDCDGKLNQDGSAIGEDFESLVQLRAEMKMIEVQP